MKQQATNTSKKITQNTQRMKTVSFNQFVTKIHRNASHSNTPESTKSMDQQLDASDQEFHDADLAVEMARYVKEMKTLCNNTPDDLKREVSPICKIESAVESTDHEDDDKHSSYIVHLPVLMQPKQKVVINKAIGVLKRAGCILEDWKDKPETPKTKKSPFINYGFIAETDSDDEDTFYRAPTPVATSSPEEEKANTSEDDKTEIYEGDEQSTSSEPSPIPLRRSKRIRAEEPGDTLSRFIRQLHQKCWNYRPIDGITRPKASGLSIKANNKFSFLTHLEDTFTSDEKETSSPTHPYEPMKTKENKHTQRKRKDKTKTLKQFTTKKVLNDDALYPNPDTPIAKDKKKIAVIYGTGAAITQFPAEHQHAWTDLRP